MSPLFSKDSFWLLFWGIVASLGAWAFWHYSGDYGFMILTVAAFISLIFDNRRLRKKLLEYQQGERGEVQK